MRFYWSVTPTCSRLLDMHTSLCGPAYSGLVLRYREVTGKIYRHVLPAREVTPRVCREAMDDGQRVIDLQAERFEELYMNSPDLDDAKHNLRRTAILLESALEGWDEQSRLCLNNRPE